MSSLPPLSIPQGLHKAEIDSTDSTETIASLAHKKLVCIFSYKIFFHMFIIHNLQNLQ
jgi:hypothetical protein